MSILLKRKLLISMIAVQAFGVCLSIEALAEDAVPAKKDPLDFTKLADPNCEAAVSEGKPAEDVDDDGKAFINTLGADGVRRVGVPRKFGVLEVIEKESPEYYAT